MHLSSGMHYIDFSGKFTLCKNFQTLITCEGKISNIICPDSMKIFIIDGFYGRNSKQEWVEYFISDSN